MGVPEGVQVCRVGFRDGTDPDLAALHAVETTIERERGSNRMPPRLDAYMAYARNLPPQFHDHAWLAENRFGEPVGCAYCWFNTAGDPRVMECDVLVRRDARRQGIGSRLLRAICEESLAEGRHLLTWSTIDTVPAGTVVSRRVRGRAARVNRTSELLLAEVDWTLVTRWTSASRARVLGYCLEIVDGAFPERLRPDAVSFHRVMRSAPREGLDVGHVNVDTGFIADLDHALIEAGRSR